MAGLPNRAEYEIRMAAELAGVGARQMRRLDSALDTPPVLTNLTPLLWADMEQEVARSISDELEAVFLAAALGLLEAFPGAHFDHAQLAMLASKWAGTHALELAGDLHRTTGSAVAELVERAAREGWQRDRLNTHLLSLFGSQRAETVAITEVTRAITAGESAIILLLAGAGIVLDPYHYTAADERVCLVCGVRHGARITDGRFAPLHPRCRCRTEWRERR